MDEEELNPTRPKHSDLAYFRDCPKLSEVELCSVASHSFRELLSVFQSSYTNKGESVVSHLKPVS